MLNAQDVIVTAEDTDGICDIGPSGGHRIHMASNHRLVYGPITGSFVGLLLVKLHRHCRGNWSGLIHSELCQDRPNVAVLMDVDGVMLPVAFNIHTEIEGGTSEIIPPDPLHHRVLDLPHQALVRNDEEIMDVQNDSGDDYTLILFVMEHEQSAIDT
jgi:hypothetical protein